MDLNSFCRARLSASLCNEPFTLAAENVLRELDDVRASNILVQDSTPPQTEPTGCLPEQQQQAGEVREKHEPDAAHTASGSNARRHSPYSQPWEPLSSRFQCQDVRLDPDFEEQIAGTVIRHRPHSHRRMPSRWNYGTNGAGTSAYSPRPPTWPAWMNGDFASPPPPAESSAELHNKFLRQYQSFLFSAPAGQNINAREGKQKKKNKKSRPKKKHAECSESTAYASSLTTTDANAEDTDATMQGDELPPPIPLGDRADGAAAESNAQSREAGESLPESKSNGGRRRKKTKKASRRSHASTDKSTLPAIESDELPDVSTAQQPPPAPRDDNNNAKVPYGNTTIHLRPQRGYRLGADGSLRPTEYHSKAVAELQGLFIPPDSDAAKLPAITKPALLAAEETQLEAEKTVEVDTPVVGQKEGGSIHGSFRNLPAWFNPWPRDASGRIFTPPDRPPAPAAPPKVP